MEQNDSYKTYFAMIGTSSFLMYILMYLHTYAIDHVFFSETRLYMNFIMTSVMALVMLWFMRHMYTNKKLNWMIIGGSTVLFVITLFLVRSQTLVDDVDYMEAMIPHHSIAILTSERAQISDPRVRELADSIIEAQREEIAEMKRLIDDLD
jgi:magnesium-transporting ATPase (P-type)